jgi:hypothetical protein
VGALLGSNQLHVSLLRCKPLLCTLCKMERLSSNIIQFLLSWFVPRPRCIGTPVRNPVD